MPIVGDINYTLQYELEHNETLQNLINATSTSPFSFEEKVIITVVLFFIFIIIAGLILAWEGTD